MKIVKRDIKNSVIIGDVHSSPDHLIRVLEQVPSDYHVFFLGDLVDRGPDPNGVVEIVHDLFEKGRATVLMGNHDWKIYRYYDSSFNVSLGHESAETVKLMKKENIKKFQDLFDEEIVGVYDTEQKILLSHAAGYRPYKLFQMLSYIRKEQTGITCDVDDMLNIPTHHLSRKKASMLIYGKTGQEKNENGFPLRLPISKDRDDDLEGWKLIYGHIHAGKLYPEHENDRVICLDFCCGEPQGFLCGLVIDNSLEEADKRNFLFST